jgi:hypothetical protein
MSPAAGNRKIARLRQLAARPVLATESGPPPQPGKTGLTARAALVPVLFGHKMLTGKLPRKPQWVPDDQVGRGKAAPGTGQGPAQPCRRRPLDGRIIPPRGPSGRIHGRLDGRARTQAEGLISLPRSAGLTSGPARQECHDPALTSKPCKLTCKMRIDGGIYADCKQRRNSGDKGRIRSCR